MHYDILDDRRCPAVVKQAEESEGTAEYLDIKTHIKPLVWH